MKTIFQNETVSVELNERNFIETISVNVKSNNSQALFSLACEVKRLQDKIAFSFENLADLQKILDEAPNENIGEHLLINENGEFILFSEDDFFERKNGKWVKCTGFLPCNKLRSADDIQKVVNLSKCNGPQAQPTATLESTVEYRFYHVNAETKDGRIIYDGVFDVNFSDQDTEKPTFLNEFYTAIKSRLSVIIKETKNIDVDNVDEWIIKSLSRL